MKISKLGPGKFNKQRIAIVGSRTFNNYYQFKNVLDQAIKSIDKLNIQIVSGDDKGADQFAERYAKQNNLKIIIRKPEWDKYGKRAGFLRNQKIVNDCDLLIAFWDFESKGTKHSIDLAKNRLKPGLIYKFYNNDKNESVIENFRDIRINYY